MIAKEISKLKASHAAKIADISSKIRAYMKEYGEKQCDHLTWLREDLAYNTGFYNALIKLENSL